MKTRLFGRILNDVGAPLASAKVSLFGGVDALGGDARAATAQPAAVSWTRAEHGLSSTLQGIWLKLIATTTAGITWEEFRAEAPTVNPSLQDTGGRFLPDQRYLLPENRHSADAQIVWDRQLSGFSGDLWTCWQQHVQGKVVGLNWRGFRREVQARNPDLVAERGAFQADRAYLLPRNAGQDEYERVTFTGASGRFAFPGLPAGSYRLEVAAEGYEPWKQDITLGDELELTIQLKPVRVLTAKAMAVSPQGIPFVQVRGSEFAIENRAFRFIGVNLRGLVHYGSDKFPGGQPEERQREQLRAANNMGARVVRVFLPVDNLDWRNGNETERRLEALLQLMEREFRHMYLIVCLTNLYEDTPFKVFGDAHGDSYYDTPWSGGKLLGRRWFAGRYEENYLRFVQKIVPQFRDRASIMAWEPGNELKVDNDPKTFVDFMLRVAQELQILAPNQLITTGMISTQHAHMDPDNANLRTERQRLMRSPLIDFITVHSYNGVDEHKEEADAKEMQKLKPVVVEEAGFVAGPNAEKEAARNPNFHLPPCVKNGRRRACVEADLHKWFDLLGARGYMQWGFMAGFDNRDGDGLSGMDHVIHSKEDWDELFGLYQQQATKLANQAGPVAPASTPAGGPTKPSGQGAAPSAMGPTLIGAQSKPPAAAVLSKPPAGPAAAVMSKPPAAAAAAQIQVGQQITVIAAKGVNVRRVPGHINKLAGDILAALPRGARLTVVEGPKPADGLTWWGVSFTRGGQPARGWVAQVDPQGVPLIAA